MKHVRFKPDRAVGKRLIKEARLAREKTEQLLPSMEREALLMEARAIDVAANIEEWLNSPGLRSPK